MQLRLHVTREALITGFATSTGSMASGTGGSVYGSFIMRGPATHKQRLPMLQGRPDTDALLEQLGREAGREGRAGRGIAVVCCGPRPMVKDVGLQVLITLYLCFDIKEPSKRRKNAIFICI